MNKLSITHYDNNHIEKLDKLNLDNFTHSGIYFINDLYDVALKEDYKSSYFTKHYNPLETNINNLSGLTETYKLQDSPNGFTTDYKYEDFLFLNKSLLFKYDTLNTDANVKWYTYNNNFVAVATSRNEENLFRYNINNSTLSILYTYNRSYIKKLRSSTSTVKEDGFNFTKDSTNLPNLLNEANTSSSFRISDNIMDHGIIPDTNLYSTLDKRPDNQSTRIEENNLRLTVEESNIYSRGLLDGRLYTMSQVFDESYSRVDYSHIERKGRYLLSKFPYKNKGVLHWEYNSLFKMMASNMSYLNYSNHNRKYTALRSSGSGALFENRDYARNMNNHMGLQDFDKIPYKNVFMSKNYYPKVQLDNPVYNNRIHSRKNINYSNTKYNKDFTLDTFKDFNNTSTYISSDKISDMESYDNVLTHQMETKENDLISKLGILIVQASDNIIMQKYINREYIFYRYKILNNSYYTGWTNWKSNLPMVTSSENDKNLESINYSIGFGSFRTDGYLHELRGKMYNEYDIKRIVNKIDIKNKFGFDIANIDNYINTYLSDKIPKSQANNLFVQESMDTITGNLDIRSNRFENSRISNSTKRGRFLFNKVSYPGTQYRLGNSNSHDKIRLGISLGYATLKNTEDLRFIGFESLYINSTTVPHKSVYNGKLLGIELTTKDITGYNINSTKDIIGENVYSYYDNVVKSYFRIGDTIKPEYVGLPKTSPALIQRIFIDNDTEKGTTIWKNPRTRTKVNPQQTYYDYDRSVFILKDIHNVKRVYTWFLESHLDGNRVYMAEYPFRTEDYTKSYLRIGREEYDVIRIDVIIDNATFTLRLNKEGYQIRSNNSNRCIFAIPAYYENESPIKKGYLQVRGYYTIVYDIEKDILFIYKMESHTDEYKPAISNKVKVRVYAKKPGWKRLDTYPGYGTGIKPLADYQIAELISNYRIGRG